MVDKLVLIRHGKTESRATDKEDRERSLTEAGWRSLEATMARSLAVLDDVDEIAIWSSPALRAQQTAQVVARAMGIDEIYEHSSLYAHDADTFRNELRSAEGCIVAVGHNPFMEDLFEQLTGFDQFLEKGAVAVIEFDEEEDEDEPAELVWFAQGPDDSRWNTLVKMEKTMAKAAKRLSSAMWILFDEPDDVEALHKTRIAIRTARSLLSFIAPYQKGKQNRKDEKNLRTILQETSHLRELDMLREEVGARDSRLDELCAEERDAECDRMISALQRHDLQRMLRRTVRDVKHIKWHSSVEARGLSQDDLRERFDAMEAGYEEEEALTDFSDAEATHTLRKHAKRLRYVASGFAQLLGEERAGVSERMEEMQDELGALCDARVNRDLIASLGERVVSEGEHTAISDELDDLATRQETNITFKMARLGSLLDE